MKLYLVFILHIVHTKQESIFTVLSSPPPPPLTTRGLGLGDHCVNCEAPGYSTSDQLWQWFLFFTVLWACYAFVEHQTMLLLLFCRSSFTAGIASFYCTVTYILVGSSTLK